MIESWNKTLAVVAKLASVPVALVMKMEQDNLSVFSKNENSQNPYQIGDSEHLNGSGLYCEEVIKSQKTLNIPNALADENWNKNPDLELNMIAYLGLPIVDDEETPFGTVCILDNKEHVFSETTIELLETIKQSFEVQLKLLHQQHLAEEKQQLEELSILIRGLSHEMNTPLGIGITTVGIIESSIEAIQKKLDCKSLNQTTLINSLNTIKQSVKLLTNSFNNAAEKVSTLQSLLISDNAKSAKKIELYPLVNSIFDSYKKMLNTHNIKYKIKQQHNEHTDAFIVPELLQQVLLILCKNSLEHGLAETKDPEIRIELINYSNVIKLHYKDNGKGIDSAEYNKIFSPFYTTSRAIGSSGVGLSIAKRIITQQLHGEISIVNSSGGVHFILSLPKATTSAVKN
ncbi:histidine kinase [Colwellia sp. 75C3]|nr:histidine kinase [Colwellia sp. 75C3]